MSKYYKVDNNTLTNMTEFLKRHFSVDERDTISCIECRSLAEKILSSLPTIEVSKDCISKAYLEQEIENQAMTVEKDKEYWRGWNNALDKVVELIEDAPSVVPTTEQSSEVGERKRGEWRASTAHSGIVKCSVCGYQAGAYAESKEYNFCPKCGAKMKGVDNE